MSKYQSVQVSTLGAGVNDFKRPNQLDINESPTTARNIRIDGNSKKPREGYTTFGAAITGGTKIQGMSGYLRDATANDRLVIAYKSTLYDIDVDNETTWSELTTTLTSDSRTEFANFKDWLLVFNGVDEPGRLEGTTYSEPFTNPSTVAGPAFLPAFGTIYLNSLWVAGVPTAANTLFISKPALTATPEDVYDFSGTLKTGAADELLFNSRVTAVRTMATLAIVFTVDGASYVNGFKDLGTEIVANILPINGASGAVSQAATVSVENDVYYLTPQKEIKSIKAEFKEGIAAKVASISDKIKNFMQKNLDDDQTKSFAVYDETNKLVKFYVKSAGSSFNDIRIVGDIRKADANGVPEWLIDDAMSFNAGVYYKNNPYLGSSIIGQTYIDEDGLADDDSVPITSLWRTKDFTAQNPTVLKKYKNVSIFGDITVSTSLTATVFVDDEEVDVVTIDSNDIPSDDQGGIGSQTVAEFAIADDELSSGTLKEFVKHIPIRVRGKKISIQFETDGINQDYRVSYFEYSFIALSPLLQEASETL